MTGMASATIPIPNRPSLAGADLFGQALMIRSPGQELLTNVTRGTLR